MLENAVSSSGKLSGKRIGKFLNTIGKNLWKSLRKLGKLWKTLQFSKIVHQVFLSFLKFFRIFLLKATQVFHWFFQRLPKFSRVFSSFSKIFTDYILKYCEIGILKFSRTYPCRAKFTGVPLMFYYQGFAKAYSGFYRVRQYFSELSWVLPIYPDFLPETFIEFYSRVFRGNERVPEFFFHYLHEFSSEFSKYSRVFSCF